MFPLYFSELPLDSSKKEFPASSIALENLFWIEKKLPQDERWINQMAEIFTQCQWRSYMNYVLIPQLLLLTESTKLTDKILLSCRECLHDRVDKQPQPPANWCRQMPSTNSYSKQWQILKAFLESPDEFIFDYRKNQSERDALQNAIGQVVIDLKTETIKKGSPHTLRITKTQDAYNKEMKKWKEDKELLNSVTKKIEGYY